MPKIGLSAMYVAKRNYDTITKTASFTGGRRFARARNYSTEVEKADGNDYYTDNVVGETAAGEFVGGTLSLTVAELEEAEAMFLLNLSDGQVEISGKTITVYDYGDATPPDLAFAVVEKWKVRGKIKWQAIILWRIVFNTPGSDVVTAEDEVEWQDTELEARIMREEQEPCRWQRRTELMDSEAEAIAFIEHELNVAATLDAPEIPEG